jgi:Na+-transporting NADH:ubiquinone oxidoreductase subunit A
MHVNAGETVRRGQLLFEDKKMPGVRFTSPGAGKVVAVNRGDKRAFESIVIELSRGEMEGRTGGADEISYSGFTKRHPSSLSELQVKELLLESGAWIALRARPFGKVANPEDKPHSIFVTAMDTNPLAPDTGVLLAGHETQFQSGLAVLAKLTDGKLFVCTDPERQIDLPQDGNIQVETFSGPHPSGTVGYHIHVLDPVDRSKTVWHIGLQDVIAIGALFESGQQRMERVVSLAGPAVREPRLIRTRIGASTDDLVADEIVGTDDRVISGSVFSGRTASGDVLGFLGRYHQQVSVLAEGRQREFLGWMAPGLDKFSVINTFVSSWLPKRKLPLTTTTNGSQRNIVPIGVYEKVMPMDLPTTVILKSLLMHDVETAEQVGCLELEEEDLALCTYVCPGKNDYGPHLREVLTTLEKEG